MGVKFFVILALGIAYGLLTDNFAVGVALGLTLGIIFSNDKKDANS